MDLYIIIYHHKYGEDVTAQYFDHRPTQDEMLREMEVELEPEEWIEATIIDKTRLRPDPLPPLYTPCSTGCPGWMVEESLYRIEKCDACKRFKSDEEAINHVRLLEYNEIRKVLQRNKPMQKRYKLVVDVTFDNADGQESRLQRNLEEMVDWAMGEGHLTDCAGEATVCRYETRVSELEPQSTVSDFKLGNRALLHDGSLLAQVTVNLRDLLQPYPDLYERYLDRLSQAATGTELLENIREQIIDVEDDGVLIVEVEGDLDTIKGMAPEEGDQECLIMGFLRQAETKLTSTDGT